jgi:hypothetical protein
MKRLLLVAFFLEVGFVLIVVPWSPYWDRNYFAQWFPSVHALITNNFVRGGVSGLGVINMAVGLTELVSMVSTRKAAPSEQRVSLTPSRLAKD